MRVHHYIVTVRPWRCTFLQNRTAAARLNYTANFRRGKLRALMRLSQNATRMCRDVSDVRFVVTVTIKGHYVHAHANRKYRRTLR